MFKRNRLSTVFAALALTLAMVPAALTAQGKPQPDRIEQFRRQLASFYAHLPENSPTVLAQQPQGKESREEIQRRIAALSREELAELAKGFAEVPNWQIAPEALASSLPQVTRDQLNTAGRHFAAKAEEATAFQNSVESVATLTGMLPPATLKKLNLKPSDVAAVQQSFSAMTPLQAAMLQERLPAGAGISTAGSTVLSSLPPSLREGLDALSEHGPLKDEEKASLQGFSKDVGTLLAEIRELPPEARKRFDAAKIEALAQRVASASPETLFLLREQVGEQEIAKALAAVRLLRRFAAMTPAERQDLEAFRADLASVLATAQTSKGEGSPLGRFEARLAAFAPEQLFVLRKALDATPAWRQVYPTVVETLNSPALAAQAKALRSAAPDPAQVADLESFRKKTLAFLEQRATGNSEEAARFAPALQVLRRATPSQLAVIKAVYERLPQDVDPAWMAAVPSVAASVDLDCRIGLGCIDFGIAEACLPDIDLNFLCSPLESAINAVASVVDSVVSAISNTVDSIWSVLQSLPDTLLAGIKSLFELLLDLKIGGYSVRDLTNPATLQQVLNLNSSFWQNLPQVPQIPCPPDGTQIPLFGQVGDGATATKYKRYKWLFDKLLGLIPDTEIGLVVKIPAQIFYGGVEYLEICLEAAAEERDAQETAAFRSEVNTALTTSLDNTSSIMNSVTTIGGQVNSGNNSLVTLIQNQSVSFSSLVRNETEAITNKLGAGVQSLSSLIEDQGADLTEQVDTLQTNSLRLAIEANLLAPTESGISWFQLPQPWGQLELVRQIVEETFAAFADAGQTVPVLAQRELDKGVIDMMSGRYKIAYAHFQMAYRIAVKP